MLCVTLPGACLVTGGPHGEACLRSGLLWTLESVGALFRIRSYPGLEGRTPFAGEVALGLEGRYSALGLLVPGPA